MSSVPNINASPSPIYQHPPLPFPPQAPRGLSDSPGLHPLSIPPKEISKNYALLNSPVTQPLPHPLTSPLHNPTFQPLVSPIAHPGLSPTVSPLVYPSFPDPSLQNELNEVKHLLRCSLESKKVLEAALETATKENRVTLQQLASLQADLAQWKDQTRALTKELESVTKQKEGLGKKIKQMELKESDIRESERRGEAERRKKLNQDLLSQVLTAQQKAKHLQEQHSRVLIRLNRCEDEYKNLIAKGKREHAQEVHALTKERLSLESRQDEALIKKEKEWLGERDALQAQIQSLQQQLSTQHAQQVKNKGGRERDKEQEEGRRLNKRTRRALPRKCKST